MPSELVVPVTIIHELSKHPNADRLEVATVLGWECIVGKGQFEEGERVVYFPPDTIIPDKRAEEFGVEKYLAPYKGGGMRIRACNLRSKKSFGLIVKLPKGGTAARWTLGQNVADYYGATKYEPPLRNSSGPGKPHGRRMAPHAGFPSFTHIGNMRNFPNIFKPGEDVILTEKIHGTNSRVGLIDGKWMAGSHRVRRQRPFGFKIAGEENGYVTRLADKVRELWNRMKKKLGLRYYLTDDATLYWHPLTIPEVTDAIEFLSIGHEHVVLYGEIFGPGIQSLHYGIKPGEFGYRAFDLKIDGQYVDYTVFRDTCTHWNIPMVPELALAEFSLDTVKAFSEGDSIVTGAENMREGVVVRPLAERVDNKHGRVIQKYVSDEYLLSKVSDFKEE